MAKGVIALLSGPRGFLEHGINFDTTYPSGFTLEAAQRHRARINLAIRFVRNFGGPIISEAAETYDCEQMINRLCNKKDYKVEYIAIDTERTGAES